MARKLRLEKEREKELMNQRGEQRNTITHANQRIMRLEAQLTDLR